MPKILLILFGAAFRHGGHSSGPVPKRQGWRQFQGVEARQIAATRSQLAFTRHLNLKYGLSADVALSTYSTPFDHVLRHELDVASSNTTRLLKGVFHEASKVRYPASQSEHLGYLAKSLRSPDWAHEYAFVLVCRVDVLIKTGAGSLYEVFDPQWSKLMVKFNSLNFHVHNRNCLSTAQHYPPQFPFVTWPTCAVTRGLWGGQGGGSSGFVDVPRNTDLLMCIPRSILARRSFPWDRVFSDGHEAYLTLTRGEIDGKSRRKGPRDAKSRQPFAAGCSIDFHFRQGDGPSKLLTPAEIGFMVGRSEFD
mmetsp:Transcript_37948/g.103575  ORF Transcript_37948/g.103575 Transcript_37948/m.103575 type:complete len:307 (+) Transcript_37948:72-992(+)